MAQLKGAISLINGVADAAVTYDLDAGGNPDYRRVTLGAGTGTTTIGNLAAGAVYGRAVDGRQQAAAARQGDHTDSRHDDTEGQTADQ